LTAYFAREAVGCVVIGEPRHADGSPTKVLPEIVGLQRKLNKLFPEIEVVLHDEAFSSVEAKEAILHSGVGRKKRREKGLVDKMAATIILRDYLEETKYDNRS
jgi:putative Holliday junction resolvase